MLTDIYMVQIVDASKWDHVFSINVRGTMLCYKHAAIQMIKQGRGGRIIGKTFDLLGTYQFYNNRRLIAGAASIAAKQGWRRIALLKMSKSR